MAELAKSQKPIVMTHYPHMLAEDTAVWTRYLRSPVILIKEVWYDIHVGRQTKTAGGPGTLEARIAAGISRKRIDAVCRVDGGYWVVEIKPFGSMLAVGQVVSYARLFVQEYRLDDEVRAVIICDQADEDVILLCEDLGVIMIEV